ncbi:hypothetical protein K502DRAFT_325455 [Neoconidiobolus thromboides FSU 785]|nr:hypothetical protein K502DRAFT_325455 [Neoconidiobolus thromboides FSU 785]
MTVDPIYTQITGEKVIFNHTACTITGFFYEIVAYFEVLFNAFLAIERVLIFKKSKVIRLIYWILTINSTVFSVLLIVCTAIGAYIRGPSTYICHLDVADYPLATFTHLFRDFICLGAVATCIHCYCEISKQVNGFLKVQYNGLELSVNHEERSKEYQTVIIKTYISLTIYGVLMFSGNLSFSIEAILHYLDKSKFKIISDPLHYIGLSFYCMGFVANTALILLFHTGIRHEVQKFYAQTKKLFKR